MSSGTVENFISGHIELGQRKEYAWVAGICAGIIMLTTAAVATHFYLASRDVTEPAAPQAAKALNIGAPVKAPTHTP